MQSSDDQVLIDVAYEYFHSGEISQATELCSKILATNRNHPDALHLLGTIFIHTGKPLLAEKYLKRAVQLQTGNAAAHYHLGKAFAALAKFDKAVLEYKKALAINPEYQDAIDWLGVVEKEIHDINLMIQALEGKNAPPSIKFSHPATIDQLNLAVALFQHFGFIIIRDLYTTDFINDLNSYFREVYSAYYNDKDFPDALKVGDKRNMITPAIEGPLNNPDLYANQAIMGILRRLLGKSFILGGIGTVFSLPGAAMQHPHPDHPNLFDDEEIDKSLPTFGVTLAIPLIEMNDVNGTTRLFAKSHRETGIFTDMDMLKNFQHGYLDPIIKVGDGILFDFHLYHQGTPNKSNNVRPLLYSLYTREWLLDHANYSKQGRISITPEEYEKIPDNKKSLFILTKILADHKGSGV